MKRSLHPLLLCFLAPGGMAFAGEPEELEMVRAAVPFLKEEGLAWIEDRKCASCHQIPSMLWSLNLAVKAGIAPEGLDLAERTSWAADWRHWNKLGAKEGETKVSAGNIDTMAFLLLGLPEDAASPEWAGPFRKHLLANQQADGSWKAGGQLPLGKRPARETTEVTTMWTMLALGDSLPAEARVKAEAFLAAAAPGRSVEWHALRFLRDPGNAALREALVALQHPDGGWGWLAAERGDAFGTGLALFALASGDPPSPSVRGRAVAFLAANQRGDGSWPVPSTRQRDLGKINETATYWGTAWAVIGLLADDKNDDP